MKHGPTLRALGAKFTEATLQNSSNVSTPECTGAYNLRVDEHEQEGSLIRVAYD